MIATCEQITTVAGLIEALGGTQAVADLRDVTFNAVSNWRVDNYLPERHRFALFQQCQEKGLSVDPALFEARRAS